MAERGAGREGVGQRATDRALGVESAEVAAGDIQIAIQDGRSVVADVLDQAACGVASEKVPCGPRSTSTRCRSNSDPANAPVEAM